MPNLNLIEKAFFLKTTHLFENLELDLLLSVGDRMESMSFRPQESIFQIHQEANQLYFILSGQIDVLDESEKLTCQLKPGDYFGDESLLNRKRRGYRAVSSTSTELLALSRSNLLKIFTEYPKVALVLLEAYALNTPFRTRNPG